MATSAARGVIYTVAPSYKDVNTIWCGTDDGLIHVTRDGGKTWSNVTPPGLTAWSKVSLIDAGRFDANTAYAAINRIRLDDQQPHILRTHDGGKTWKEIVRGLPDDPGQRRARRSGAQGLALCGTERAVYVSFNDGDDWQPLRLNMPATSIRDLVDPRRRSRRRHARPIVLDSRRHHAAAATDARGRRVKRISVRSAGGDARPLEPEHRHAAAAREPVIILVFLFMNGGKEGYNSIRGFPFIPPSYWDPVKLTYWSPWFYNENAYDTVVRKYPEIMVLAFKTSED